MDNKKGHLLKVQNHIRTCSSLLGLASLSQEPMYLALNKMVSEKGNTHIKSNQSSKTTLFIRRNLNSINRGLNTNNLLVFPQLMSLLNGSSLLMDMYLLVSPILGLRIKSDKILHNSKMKVCPITILTSSRNPSQNLLFRNKSPKSGLNRTFKMFQLN